MKYIITAISGKQFIFKKGFWYDIDHITRESNQKFITLEKLLLFRNETKVQIGKPFLTNSLITATIISDISGKKIKVFKTKPKKHYSKTQGYKHKYTRILIL